MKTEVKLKIADIVIRMESDFPLVAQTQEWAKERIAQRFNSFLYKGNVQPEILIEVRMVDKLPQIKGARRIFIVCRQGNARNWQLLKKDSAYIYKTPLEEEEQVMFVNKSFDKVIAYILPMPDLAKAAKYFSINIDKVWDFADIIYDFLQVLLINYLALHKKGVLVHGAGVKDIDGSGFLFSGKSGAGKTTTARIWHKHSKAMVLNDDRIIVRKINGKFRIFGSPWHGDFYDCPQALIESATLNKLFFICHSSRNKARLVSKKEEAFRLFFPMLFPAFWEKECLENISSFSFDLVKNIPSYSLGFIKNEKVIDFVRRLINRHNDKEYDG